MDTFPRWLAGILALAVFALLGGGAWFYRVQEQQLRHDAETGIEAIAQLKVNQIADWRSARLADAAVLMERFDLIADVEQWSAEPTDETAEALRLRFRSIHKHYRYHDVLLVDPDGKVRLSLSGYAGTHHDGATEALAAALRDRKPVFTDLHTERDEPTRHLSVVAPIFSTSGKAPRPLGAVILVNDAGQFLYPFIQSWPLPSRSGETLLVRRDGNHVLFLNDLRHHKDAGLKLRIPLNHGDVPGVQAVLGQEGVVHGQDYRGVEVLAALKPIPDSPWFMVAKVDATEAFAVWRFRSFFILATLLGVVAFAGAAVLLLWQRNRKAYYQALYQSEAARRRSEERHRITLMSVGDAVITTDAEGRVELLNPVAEALTGWTNAEAHGRLLDEVFRIINEETRQPVENPVEKVLREDLIVGLANHTLLIAKDGTEWPIADSSAPIRNEKGATIGAVLVFRDQREERAAEKALRREKAAAQQYLNIAGVMMVALDASANVILVNQKGCAILGYPEEEILGRNWFQQFLPTRVRESMKGVFGQIVAGELRLNEYVENHVQCRGGEERLIAWHNTVIRDEAGGIVGTLSSGEDITERRRAEQALGESEARYRTLFERTANPVLVIDTDGNYVDANAAALEFLEFTREEMLMKNIRDFVPPGQEAETIPSLQDLWAGGGRIEREYSVCGALKTLDLTITPGTWQGKQVVFCVGTDITERKIAEKERLDLERKLHQALKAESLGRMAGAIAHHFNNLLGVVMGNLELAMDDLSPAAKPGVNLSEAMKATRRAAEVSGRMLSYLGQRPGDKQPLDLVQSCRESLSMLQTSLPGNVVLRTEFSDARPIIRADAAQMRQILSNLFTNACEAMDAGEGEVRVSAGVLRADELREVQVFPLDWEPSEDVYAYIEVSDTGCGMDVKVRDRIFDPFFSTKFTGRGLGLAVVEGIIRSHEGAVTVRSAPGLGSTFRVMLPLLRCEVLERQPVAAAVSSPPEAAAKILLVEDEPMVRNMAQTMLERLGYQVLTAVDGAEAVEVFGERSAEIACVLLDLTMPRMDGWEALSVLRSLRPDVPVVLFSGYDEGRVMAGSHPHKPQAFLHKPYQMADLKAALARIVSAPPAETESG